MTATRRLAAIMYSDIAGFSSLMYSDPDLASQIRERHLSIFREAHEKYHGKIIQHFGDSTLSVFRSAAEAVECAYFLQLELRRSPEIPLRIGIHSGEIIQDDRGAYGEGITIASRVERMSDPGSIFLSAKVHDDIHHHPWITTQSLGIHKLDDLDREMELFAVTNRGLVTPSLFHPVRESRSRPDPVTEPEAFDLFSENYGEGKKKHIAALLAFFLGPTGAHRFYLGQRFRAFLYIAATVILSIVSFEEGAPFLFIMFIISILDAVLLAVMPSMEFEVKFNKLPPDRKETRRENKVKKRENLESFRLLKDAVKKFESGQYEKAIILFDRVLAKDKRNAAAHFYLACCFSMLRDSDDAFYHLEAALDSGFHDIDRIEEEKSLKYIRNQSRFQAFRHTYLKVPLASLPSPTSNLLDKKPSLSAFEKIELLGEKLAKGELTAEEFEAEKVKILNT
jgi:class 3 adenylate cyclase/TM2 domain-containing membrane protein YozV